MVAYCSCDVHRVMFNPHVLGFVAPRRINLKSHQTFYFNSKSVGCRSFRAVTSTINVQSASNKNNYVHEDDLHVCINFCEIKRLLWLDILYGLCQLLVIVAPRRINLKSHQVFLFNTKAVGCRSWRAITSAVNVQFA